MPAALRSQDGNNRGDSGSCIWAVVRTTAVRVWPRYAIPITATTINNIDSRRQAERWADDERLKLALSTSAEKYTSVHS